MHGIALRDGLHHQGVADLVIGDDRLLFRRNHPAPLFRASHHAKAGFLQLETADRHFLVARRQDGGLVQEIGEVGAREAGRLPRDNVEIDVLGEWLVGGVEAQDGATAIEVGGVDRDPPIEAAGAEQRRVEHVRAVGGRNHDHGTVGIEAVHLDQQLVEGLFAFLVSADLRAATPAAERVDLIEKDDARCVFLGVLEEVAHARRADADEHLDEVRATQGVVGNLGLARHRAGEERLAGAGGADQQDAPRHACPQLTETAGRLEELDDFLELVLRLVDADHLGKRDPLAVTGAGLGEMLGHRPHWISEKVRAPEQHEQERQKEEQANQVREHGRDRGLVGGLHRDLHVVTAQVLLGRAHRRFLLNGPRLPAGAVRQQDALPADTGRRDLAAVDTIEDVADRHARLVPDAVGSGVPEEP